MQDSPTVRDHHDSTFTCIPEEYQKSPTIHGEDSREFTEWEGHFTRIAEEYRKNTGSILEEKKQSPPPRSCYFESVI